MPSLKSIRKKLKNKETVGAFNSLLFEMGRNTIIKMVGRPPENEEEEKDLNEVVDGWLRLAMINRFDRDFLVGAYGRPPENEEEENILNQTLSDWQYLGELGRRANKK